MKQTKRFLVKKMIPYLLSPGNFDETLIDSFDDPQKAFECLYDPELPVLTDGEYIIYDTVENKEI